jgi:hypothetical protein
VDIFSEWSKMSEANLKLVYERVIKDVRSDLEILKKMYAVMASKIGNRAPNEEAQKWIMDVYVDKLYQIEQKLNQIFRDIPTANLNPGNTKNVTARLVSSLHNLAFASLEREYLGWQQKITHELNDYIKWVEWDLTCLRQKLIQLGWTGMESVTPVKYIALERKTYVSARDELDKAKEKIQSDPEDVMMHLRNAIDYSLKEKFGFADIRPMKRFFDDAEKYGLPLPSYGMIYQLYDEGSERIHQGKIHTEFERELSIKMVDSFIDNLQLMEVDVERIQNFKSLSKSVE